ncbi:MAG: hypothetical protein M3O31_02100 [Acidobacteriota bacterium]|nr:hypothetical protein [Acidobacteriota bacterium]
MFAMPPAPHLLHYLQFLPEFLVFHVSFTQHNVLTGDERKLFPKAHRDRFEWIALLAYRRATLSHDGGWVSLDDIARLPRWTGRSRRHTRDNVARYLRDIKENGIGVLEVKSGSSGPYRLTEIPTEISFDMPLADIERELRIAPLRPEVHRDDLIRFVLRFVRAQLLFQQGKLISTATGTQSQNAHKIFTDLVNDFPANPRLQLIGLLAAVRVQFRVGRFHAAHETLIQHESLVKQAKDTVLEAQYYLSLAWSYRRAESGTQSNRLVEATLSKARQCASESGDRGSLGLLAYRTAWSLARKTRYEDALLQMAFAVEAAVITVDIMALQAYCADLGSIVHRMGPATTGRLGDGFLQASCLPDGPDWGVTMPTVK